MSNQIFDDRLKRIEKRNRGGAQAELIAGVGDTEDAKETAKEGASRPKASIFLALFGAAVGFACLKVIKDQLGLQAVMTLPPEMLLEIGLSEPMIGAAAVVLGFCALLAVYSLLRGRKVANTMSFAWGAVGSVAGGAAAALI